MIRCGVACVLLCMMALPASARPRHTSDHVIGKAYYTETGGASWYGDWHEGKTTADGSTFDPAEFTAAHPSLKFGTILRVVNLANHRSVEVRVTDRGPHAKDRIIDVSAAAARELGMWRRGTARVRISAYDFDQFPN